MLEFAIPEQAQRDMLLDWVAWNLQNEGNKPTWAIMLYSETKGTGKSTIAKVLTALFGEANTALCNGIKPSDAKICRR
jgi:phage/plasmid-associated DNA primase